jgi:hypothetical protein
MSKKYTLRESNAILKDVADRGYSIIANIRKELHNMALTPEEVTEGDVSIPKVADAKRLCGLIAAVSEILSPAFDISLQLCAKENLVFIAQVHEQHRKYMHSLRAMPATPPIMTPEDIQ